MLVLISPVRVYIAQRLQHASATLPGCATRPQFSLTGSHMLTSARHFLLFPPTKYSSQRKSAFYLYLVHLIWAELSLLLPQVIFSTFRKVFFFNMKTQHFCECETTRFHLWICIEQFLSPGCAPGGDEAAEMAVAIHKAPPVVGMRNAPHPSPALDGQC